MIHDFGILESLGLNLMNCGKVGRTLAPHLGRRVPEHNCENGDSLHLAFVSLRRFADLPKDLAENAEPSVGVGRSKAKTANQAAHFQFTGFSC